MSNLKKGQEQPVREVLARGPAAEALIGELAEANGIPTPVLIDAAAALGVRTQRGRWWLPG